MSVTKNEATEYDALQRRLLATCCLKSQDYKTTFAKFIIAENRDGSARQDAAQNTPHPQNAAGLAKLRSSIGWYMDLCMFCF